MNLIKGAIGLINKVINKDQAVKVKRQWKPITLIVFAALVVAHQAGLIPESLMIEAIISLLSDGAVTTQAGLN